MSFSVGIVGLPNVGKSTLFKALTKNKVDIAPYPFTTIHPNYGLVHVPDERLEKVAETIKPEKITPTVIEFVDIAGLVKGAHKGEGLGNQFLAEIRNCDAILEIVRAFGDNKVENVLGEINPEKETEIINTELLMKDLETSDGLLQKAEKGGKNPPAGGDKKSLKEFELFKKIKDGISQGKLVSQIDLTDEERAEIKGYQFLTEKAVLYIINSNGKTSFSKPSFNHLVMDLRDEEEISELSEKDKEELTLNSRLDELIKACYNILGLITFFTIAGGKEIRAWTLKKGKVALEAGGVVHTDFQEKFIRAEVINWDKLVESSSWSKAREKGLVKTVGKDYIVQDGDVMEFKI